MGLPNAFGCSLFIFSLPFMTKISSIDFELNLVEDNVSFTFSQF